MLRKSLSFPCFPSFSVLGSHQKATRSSHCLYLLNPHINKNCKYTTCYKEARVSDILEIMGPLEVVTPHTSAPFHVDLLRNSIKTNDILMGRLVHVHLLKLGLDSTCVVSNVLLDMYVKVGSLGESIQLFDEMPSKDVASWCTLISGHIKYGFYFEAIGLFRNMQEDGLKPNHFVLATILKACASSAVMEFGIQIHGLCTKAGFQYDGYVETALLDMYVKCGFLAEAHELFNEITEKKSISWNVLMSGYCQYGSFMGAVSLCKIMCRTGLVLDLVSLRLLMSAGHALDSMDFCRNIHVYSIKIGLDDDNFVQAELLQVAAKCGDMTYMHKLFNTITTANAALFSIVISGCHLQGQRDEALKCSEQLLHSDLSLNQGSLINILNLCLCEKEGAHLHACILKNGFELHLSIGNALMSMYIRCGKLEAANLTFFKMPVRDLISWTAIISGHVQNLKYREALQLFCALRETSLGLDEYAVATVLNACTGVQAVEQGKQVHTLALKLGIGFCDFLTASLLHLYAKCGWIEGARILFTSLLSPHSLVLTNIMLAGYCWNLQPDTALNLFYEEYQMGLVPDHFSYCTVLSACADLRSIDLGQQVRSCVIKSGFSDIVVCNAIMNLYLKCGSLDNTAKSFYGMMERNSISYTILLTGYMRHGSSHEALRLFHEMHQIGVRPDPVAFSAILRVCTDLAAVTLAAVTLGRQVHALVLKMGLMSDIYLGNDFIGMYSKSVCMSEARKVFEEMPMRDEVLWNSMITGYLQVGSQDGAFELISLMNQDEVNQDYFSYVGIFNACAGAALMQGTCVHACTV